MRCRYKRSCHSCATTYETSSYRPDICQFLAPQPKDANSVYSENMYTIAPGNQNCTLTSHLASTDSASLIEQPYTRISIKSMAPTPNGHIRGHSEGKQGNFNWQGGANSSTFPFQLTLELYGSCDWLAGERIRAGSLTANLHISTPACLGKPRLMVENIEELATKFDPGARVQLGKRMVQMGREADFFHSM